MKLKIRNVSRREKQKTNTRNIIVITSVALVIAMFAVLWIVTRPSGRLEVVFSKEFDFNVRCSAIDPEGSYCFFGGSNSTLQITDSKGLEIAKFRTGNEILEIKTVPQKRYIVIRSNPVVECYTYDGKLNWTLNIPEYYPDVVQLISRSRVGVYMRSMRGEKPMAIICDLDTGKSLLQQKLEIQANDIMPAFTMDGQKLVFEIQPGVIGMVKLEKDLPIVWQTHLNTKKGRFSNLDVKVTNSNLVVCYFVNDSQKDSEMDLVSNVFVIDGNREIPKDSENLEMPLLWTAEVKGGINYVLVDAGSDNILVQAQQLFVYNRVGKVLAKQTGESFYSTPYIGNHRYVSSFFLDTPDGKTVQFAAHGIDREGLLWRYTISQEYILPVFTPDCETMLVMTSENKRVTLLRLAQ
jgi:hypothetical protein